MGWDFKPPSYAAVAAGGLLNQFANTQLQRWTRPAAMGSISTESVPGFRRGSLKGMARSRTRTRTRTKRRRRGRRNFKKRRYALGIPLRTNKILRSSFNFTLDPGAGTIVREYISLNSIVDPSGSVGTRQPLYHDQWAAMYRRYCVLGYKIRIEILSTDNTNGVVVGFTPLPEATTALASFLSYKECRGTVSCLASPDVDRNELRTRGSVKGWMMPNGGKILSEFTLSGTTGASGEVDPSRLLYGHIWAQAIDGASNPSAITLVVTLDQIVCYWNPYIPAAS